MILNARNSDTAAPASKRGTPATTFAVKIYYLATYFLILPSFKPKIEFRFNWQSLGYALIAKKAGNMVGGVSLGETVLLMWEIPLL